MLNLRFNIGLLNVNLTFNIVYFNFKKNAQNNVQYIHVFSLNAERNIL